MKAQSKDHSYSEITCAIGNVADFVQEMVYYDRLLSEEECEQVERCFAEKYGLALPVGSHAR